MAWEVETETEVTDWYLKLSGNERDIVAAHIVLLADFGHQLRMPHSRPLGNGPWSCALRHVTVILTV